MIIVKLMGGLGNQMFQYATARRLAKRHGVELKLDLSLYNGTNRWPYELERFHIQAAKATDEEVREAPRPQVKTLKSWVKQAIKGAPAGRFQSVVERGFSFDLYGLVGDDSGQVGAFNPSVLNAPDNSYLLGFWQSERYFADEAETIRQDFTFRVGPEGDNLKMADQIRSTTAVSLHVRRGDYISDGGANKFHGTTTLDYYRTAIAKLSEEVEEPHFYVFSDDPDWCRENLKSDRPMTYVDHNPPTKGYEDMRLMSLCQHHIIANSSFSWWGAWLNPREDKIVYGPTRWFQETKVNTEDVIPQSWRKI